MRDAVGHSDTTPISWSPDDAVVFAVAVGADPAADLDYLDLSRGPLVLPTFIGGRMFRAGQASTLYEPSALDPGATFTLSCDMSFHRLAPSATDSGVARNEIIAVWDKRSAGLFATETSVAIEDQLVCSVITTMLVQGRGNFGGERGPSRKPAPLLDDVVAVDLRLPANSAALYQLVGEHNPHSLDPSFAAEMGLPGPISAGQLLIGAAARTLTARFAGSDHGALRRIAVDFAGSHIIGQPLTMQVQADGDDAVDFAVHAGDQPILLGGRAELG